MATFNVTIGAYGNLPPSQIGNKTINLDFNATHVFTLSDFQNTIPVYQDPEGDAIETVKVVTIPTIGIVYLLAAPVIATQEIPIADVIAGNLTYVADIGTPAGYTDNVMTFDLSDVGSSTFSGLTPGIITFIVGAQENQPPSEVGDGSATIDYAETLVFTSAMFTTGTTPIYSDPEGDNPAAVKILTLPTLGIIYYNGSPVSTNQVISVADIDAGLLTYVPDNADIDGDLQSFTFAVSDTGSGEFVE